LVLHMPGFPELTRSDREGNVLHLVYANELC
jgi:hypothetical protein